MRLVGRSGNVASAVADNEGIAFQRVDRSHSHRCTSCTFDHGAYETMELLSQCHVAANFHAALHMGRNQVSPAFDDIDEIPLVTADRAVGIALRFLNVEGAVVHGDKPASYLVDIEKIGAMNTAQHRRVFLHPVNVEDFLGSLGATVGRPWFEQHTSGSAVASGNPEWKAEHFVLAGIDFRQVEALDDHDTSAEQGSMDLRAAG